MKTMRQNRWALLLAGIVALYLLNKNSLAQQGDAGVTEKLGATLALDSTLNDEEGRKITVRQLVDKPTILTLNYFSCAGICTPLLNGLVNALNEMELQPGRDFQVITVSFDPKDTPEIAYQKRINYLSEMKRPFPPAGWRFLTGDAQNTKRVADSVGFGYRFEENQYTHSAAIMIISPSGKISRYIYGISFLPADLQLSLQEAAGNQALPSISRAAEFCYSYDPASKKYVLNVTRVVGVLSLTLAGVFVAFVVVKGRSRRNR